MKREQIIGGSTMDNHYRVRTIVSCVALAMSQMAAIGVAQADSAIGQNTTLGNARHVAPVNPLAEQADVLDAEAKLPTSRTPTGQMYGVPYAVADAPEGNASSVHLTVETGAINVSGGNDALRFKEYKDVKSGIAVDSFSLQAETPADSKYVEVVGGGVGSDDQFYGVQFGKYNDWKVKGFYNETPHVFSTTSKVIWNGIGTGDLRLPSNLPAGAGVTFTGNYLSTNGNVTTAAPYLTNVTLNQYCNGAIGAICATNPLFLAPTYGFNTPVTLAALPAATAPGVVSPATFGTSNTATMVTTASQLATVATNATNGGVNAQAGRAIIAAQNALGFSEIGLIRKNGGLSFEGDLTDSLKFFATATTEKRVGARPFAMVQGTFGGPSIEIPEPIDYATTDFKAGLKFVSDLTQFNVVATANIFHNSIQTLTVDMPMLAVASATGAQMDQGRMALAPSNKAYSVKAELSRDLPDFYRSNLTATASWGTTQQNEALLPQTITSGTGIVPAFPAGNAGLLGQFSGNFNEWNTTAGLSKQNAGARIDTRLIDLKLSLHPTDKLSLAAKARYQGTDNQTNYLNCNPAAHYADGTQYTAWGCTGVWGSVYADGAGNRLLNNYGVTSGVINTAGAIPSSWTGLGPMRNIPWENTQHVMGVSGDYRLAKFTTINASLDRETVSRRNREVNTTTEDKLKLGYTNRGIGDATLRLSYENDRKRGDGYSPLANYLPFGGESFYNLANTPNSAANTTNLANAVVAKAYNLRKFDVADRDQNIFNARLNYALRTNLDVGASYQYKAVEYPEANTEGRQNSKQQSLNLDLNYQPSAGQSVYAFYSRQQSSMLQNDVQNGAQTTAAATGTTPALAPAFVCNLGVNTTWGIITASNAAFICGTPSHNISFDPLKQYSVESKDTNDVLGIGWRQLLVKNTLDVNLKYSISKTAISYNYVNPITAGETTAVSNAVGLAATAGNGMPDMTYSSLQLNESLLIPVNKQMTVRLSASQEYGSSTDWHYPSSLQQNLVLGTGNAVNSVQMDAGPQNYHVYTVGVMMNYKM